MEKPIDQYVTNEDIANGIEDEYGMVWCIAQTANGC